MQSTICRFIPSGLPFSATCFADCAVIAMLLAGLTRAKLLALKETPEVIVLSMTFRAYTAVRGPIQIGGSIRIQTSHVAP